MTVPLRPWSWLLPALLALTGCAHKPDYERPELPLKGVSGPRLPSFAGGPAAVLLTNSTPFSARIEWRSAAAGPDSAPIAGHLLSRGSRILFAPESEPPADRRLPPGGYTWIWDVTAQRGWLLSETLQGYAPVSAPQPVTRVAAGDPAPVARRPQNHPCEQQRYEFTLGQDTSRVLQVFRATDLNGLPVEIRSDDPGTGFVMTLSRLRLEEPPASMFEPPASFTAYPSAETMVDELAMRQRKLRGRGD